MGSKEEFVDLMSSEFEMSMTGKKKKLTFFLGLQIK